MSFALFSANGVTRQHMSRLLHKNEQSRPRQVGHNRLSLCSFDSKMGNLNMSCGWPFSPPSHDVLLRKYLVAQAHQAETEKAKKDAYRKAMTAYGAGRWGEHGPSPLLFRLNVWFPSLNIACVPKNYEILWGRYKQASRRSSAAEKKRDAALRRLLQREAMDEALSLSSALARREDAARNELRRLEVIRSDLRVR